MKLKKKVDSSFSALLIRGLPDGVTNATIFDSLASLVCLSSISMIKVDSINNFLSLITNFQLSESKRFAYLQMKSSDEAKMLLNLTYKSPIKIKDKDGELG